MGKPISNRKFFRKNSKINVDLGQKYRNPGIVSCQSLCELWVLKSLVCFTHILPYSVMNPHLLIAADLARLHRTSLDLGNIIRMEGVRNYTRFISTHGQPTMTCRSLGSYIEKLPDQFIRVHKSHVINSGYILSINKENYCIFMQDGAKIPIARRKRAFILKLLKKGSI